jgi:hypothetical protein
MALQIGDTAPDFEAETTEGTVRFHDWIGDSWAVLFSRRAMRRTIRRVGVAQALHPDRPAAERELAQSPAPGSRSLS